MKIKYKDGSEQETDLMRDILAQHSEALENSRKILEKNKLYFFIFTLDEEGNRSCAFNVPSESKSQLKLLDCIDHHLKDYSSGRLSVSFNNIED
jgi:hypothetical protein